jgi:hypothetical protein
MLVVALVVQLPLVLLVTDLLVVALAVMVQLHQLQAHP